MTVVQAEVKSFELTAGFSEQFAMTQALGRLQAVFPNDIVAINFQLEHEPRSGFTLPCFMACFGYYHSACGSTPDHAVNKLLRYNGITRVEEYVRAQGYTPRGFNDD